MGRLLRVRAQQPERRDEMDGVEEVGCELALSGCDAVEVLPPAPLLDRPRNMRISGYY
jgi:hypothetical protein